MKSFLRYLQEKMTKKHMVLALARMNPITAGHEKAVGKLKEIAAAKGADHTLLVSHSHDPKSNPLKPEDKMKHLTRAFPDTNIKMTSKDHGIIQHLDHLHDSGYTHVTMVAGQDRLDNYHTMIKRYNSGGKFKSLKVISAGKRNDNSTDSVEKISASKMRDFARKDDFDSFKTNLPSKLRDNESHSKDIYNDVKKHLK